MDEVDDVIAQLLKDNSTKKKVPKTNNFLIDLIRRLIKGSLGAILLFLITIFCAFALKKYLSHFHVYTTKMEVMIMKEKDGNKNGSISQEVMEEITGWRTTYNKLDEIRIMRSRSVVDRMIRGCGYLDTSYARKTKALGHALTPSDSAEVYDACLKEFTNAIEISYDEKTDNKTSLLDFKVNGYKGKSKQMLVELVNAYNAYTKDYSDQCYDATLHCLGVAIDSVRRELDKLDDFDRDYSTKNFIINVDRQSEVYLNSDEDRTMDVKNMQLQRQLLRIIRNYMADMGKNYTIVPANTGIDDPQINRIVLDFNNLVMHRSNYLTSMGEDAMRVQTITNQIEDQRQAIIVSIDKLTESFDIRLAKYEENQDESNSRLMTMPEKKLVKDYIDRERDILSPMYQRLQEKYTETLIAKASEQPPARIVTSPYVTESLLFGSNKTFFMLSVILGIVLALIYLWKLDLPERELEVEDILARCVLPIWGILPDVSEIKLFGPAVRSLMTRVEMENAKTILITSGYQGEGKTFFMNQIVEYFVDNEMDFEFYYWKDIESAKDVAREDSAKHLSDVEDLKDIISRNRGTGKYLLIDGGSYHENPELPLLSREADATIYTIRAEHSSVLSLDFCNFAVQDKLLFNGAVVIVQAPVNKKYEVSFCNFDYEVPSSFGLIINQFKRK